MGGFYDTTRALSGIIGRITAVRGSYWYSFLHPVSQECGDRPEVCRGSEAAAGPPSYLEHVTRSRRRLGWLVMLAAVGAAALAGCGEGPDRFADQRSWAPVPDQVRMPEAAPDDPAAYRGVRFRIIEWMGAGPGGGPTVCRDGRPLGSCPPSVEAGGRDVPWLRVVPAGYSSALAGPDGPYFGETSVFDGRRWMVWFFRLLEAPTPTPDPFIGASPYPPIAVLDVLVQPGELREGALRWGCGPAFRTSWGPFTRDSVIIVGDDGWLLNRGTGRIEPTDPDDADCPDD
jgi:hypothetical protein